MKRPPKIGVEQPQPEQIKIIPLGSLTPCRLGHGGISDIASRAARLAASWGTQERSKVLQAEDAVMALLSSILKTAAGGDQQAARASHRIAEKLVLKMNELAARDTELWNPILAKAIGWPVIGTKIPDEQARNKLLLDRVGAESLYRSFPAPGAKSIRVQQTPMNALTTLLGGGLNVLNATVNHIAGGDTDEKTFSDRADTLCASLPGGIEASGIRAVLDDLRARGGFGRPTRKELAGMIFAWLDAEAGGRIEDVDFLRKRGINAHALEADTDGRIDRWIRKLKKSNGSGITDQDRVNFLLRHRGTKPCETAIRGQILQAIRESLNWHNPPAEARQ